MFNRKSVVRLTIVVVAITAIMSAFSFSAAASPWVGMSSFFESFFQQDDRSGAESPLDQARDTSQDKEAAINKWEPEAKYDSDGGGSNLITTGTYAFTNSTGVSLEDMSTGTSILVAPGQDDTTSPVTIMPMDFYFDGVRYNQFSVNANGLMRLGGTVISTAFTNDLATTTNSPQIAPYWDDLWVGNNGKVHWKVVGTAPSRKLVVEWQNEQVPRNAANNNGAGTFQAWLYETTGVIEFVYGSGMAANAANSGYSVGFEYSTTTNFASVTTAGPTVSYAASNNAQTNAITAGTKYTFTPVAPNAPSGVNFTGVTGTAMNVNWVDNSTTESGFAVYRSTDGGSTYQFQTFTAANTVTYAATGLGNNQTYTWAVYAVSEGAFSAAATGSQLTTTGTKSGTYSVGPTGTYASLTAAFGDITTNGLSGSVILELQSTYVSSVESFPLIPPVNASPSNTITVRPATGATALSITSSTVQQTIDLAAAKYVTFDGRAGGAGTTKDLTIANTDPTFAGVAVRFINESQNNALRYVNIRGVTSSTSSGVVLFSTTTGTFGNDNNTIDNCDIRDGATTPTNLIYGSGTNTTLATNNSGNVISNSTLANFYNSTSTSLGGVGVNLATGNVEWSITGNSFFQTSTRTTFGAGTTVNAILISNSNNYGNSITSNFIGGTAANCGGSAWTINASTTAIFRGIQMTVSSAAPTSVQGNTIQNISITTTSASTAQSAISAVTGSFNIGNVSGNTIGSTSGNSISFSTSGTSAIFSGILAGTGTIAAANISGNTIAGISVAGSGTSGLRGISVQGSGAAGGTAGVIGYTLSNNTIGSTSTANSLTNSTNVTVYGIFAGSSVVGTVISGNTIANVSSTTTLTTAQVVGILHQGSSGGTASITGSTIRNLSSSAANVGTGSSSSVVGIAMTASTTPQQTVSTNTVRSLANSTASAAVAVTGIHYGGPAAGGTGVTNTVARNFVHTLSAASTSTSAVITGINVTAGTTTFQNNMVRLGFFDDATPTSMTVGMSIIGINETTGTNNFYHNTSYVGGTGVASIANTAAFSSTVTSNTRAFRDNVFANNRQNTSGTAVNVAAIYAGTLPSPSGLTLSHNVYFASVSSATIRSSTAATNYTLAGWQAASALDSGSVFATLAQINLVSAEGNATAVDLHVQSPTVVEAAGTDVGVTDDYDGQTRSGLTPVDVGADAGAFTPLDLSPPTITYTTLANTASTSNRVLAATITDASGVASGATSPRIYFKKSTDASYVSTQCSGSYSCTIDYSLVGGGSVVANDIIQYFVVAQDTVGNLAANPSGGFVGTNVNTVTTPPTTPNSYTILPSISGTKTVGSGGDYPTLTAAIAAVNGAELSGAVTLSLLNATYDTAGGETFPLSINANNGSSSTNTITIKPAIGVTSTITGSSAGCILTLNGADYVNVDGSNVVNGTTRNLTISNTNVGTSSAVVCVLSPTVSNGATNDTVKNSIISGNSSTTTLFGIYSGGATVGTSVPALVANSTNTYQNNKVSKAQYGIYVNGVSTASLDGGLTISGNNIGSSTSGDGTSITGIFAKSQTGASISGNDVQNVTGSGATNMTGVSLVDSKVSTVSANAIHALNYNGSSTTKVYGLYSVATSFATAGTQSANNYVNNTVYDAITGCTSSLWCLSGINNEGGYGDKYYFNSVSLTGVLTGSSASGSSVAAFSIGNGLTGATSTSGGFDIRNNAFSVTGTSTATITVYDHFTTLVNYSGSTINYNDLYVSTTGSVTGKVGRINAVDSTDLTAWKTATGLEANSIGTNPAFNSSTDLRPQLGSPVVGGGQFGTGISVDFLGAARNNPPTIGAYENAVDVAGPAITYTAFANTTSTSNRTLTATITDPSGVDGGATAPRIYFKKSTDASYVSTQCTGSYSCVIDYTLVGGGSVTTGEIIQYFVVAQDTLGNLSSNPSAGFVGTNVNTVTTPPTTPNSYQISIGYSGSYNVGSAETITSLTNAGGIFALMNAGVVTGNVTINITSDLTGETGTNALNQQAEEGGGAGTYTVTIKPSGAARTITSTTTATGLITLNGADRVTIDGSLSGGTDRSLTLFNQNSTSSGTTVVGLFSSGIGAGAVNNTIKNTIVQNGTKFEASTTSFNFGIYAGSGSTSASADNDNLTIQNNLVQRCNIGIQAIGFTGGALDGLLVQDNTVGGAVLADYFGLDGMIFGNATGATVTRNTVRNALFTAALDGGGIFLSTGFVNSSVTRNNVNNLEANNSGGYGMTGIYVATATASSSLTVANNFIYNIRGTSWTTGVLGDTVVGIRVAGTSTGGVNIWHNSVNLYGSYAGASGSATVTAAFMVNGTTVTNLNVRNNIFVNTFDNNLGTGDKSYAVYTSTANTMFAAIDYNNYLVSGSAPGVLGAINAVDASTLATLGAASGGDSNSKNVDPQYVSSTDLHLLNPSNAVVSAGTAIGAVTVDYDGDPRPASAPDMGADEIVQAQGGNIAGGTYYNASFAGSNTLTGNVTVSNTLFLNGITNGSTFTTTLPCGSSVSGAGATSFIIGNVNRQYCATGSFTYPVGTGTQYSPMTATITTLNTNPSSLSAQAVAGTIPGTDPTQSVQRNWNVVETGDLVADMLFDYAPGDVIGTEANFDILKKEGNNAISSVCSNGACINTGTNDATITGVSLFSRWGMGKVLAPTAANVSLSGRVVTADGRGIKNVMVVVTGNTLAEPRVAITGNFGYYRFDNLDAGETYIVNISSKRFFFQAPSRVISLNDSVEDIDFVADPQE